MRTSTRIRRARRANSAQRAELLAAFDRSGLSAAAFAQQHGLNYTTFCGWRRRRSKAKPVAGFVEVELGRLPDPTELVVELSGQVRVHISSVGQIELAARLLQALHPALSC